MAKKHLQPIKVLPADLRLTRDEYQMFPLEVFRKHIYQEEYAQRAGQVKRHSELVDAALAKSRARNLKRLREANERDNSILGKYLPSDAIFFPFGLKSPDDFEVPTEEWSQTLLEGEVLVAYEGMLCLRQGQGVRIIAASPIDSK
jgi:hypothetical protein